MLPTRSAPLPTPRTFISNPVMGGILVSFVGLSYYWSMHAVGGTDLEKEVRTASATAPRPGQLFMFDSRVRLGC